MKERFWRSRFEVPTLVDGTAINPSTIVFAKKLKNILSQQLTIIVSIPSIPQIIEEFLYRKHRLIGVIDGA
jgi:hypothetical protein